MSLRFSNENYVNRLVHTSYNNVNRLGKYYKLKVTQFPNIIMEIRRKRGLNYKILLKHWTITIHKDISNIILSVLYVLSETAQRPNLFLLLIPKINQAF